ncbi:MAG: hypothetical protein ACR2J4_11260 [Deinococcus sp.]
MEQVARYIITRPCLNEGSLRLQKYLRPLFPEAGEIIFTDARGQNYPVQVMGAQGRLTGLGELYRAHHLNVNDVLLIQPGQDGQYRVDCVVKPHARPADRPLPTPPPAEKRVVIHATPHVREVRVERVRGATPAQAGGEREGAGQTGVNQAGAVQTRPPTLMAVEDLRFPEPETAQAAAQVPSHLPGIQTPKVVVTSGPSQHPPLPVETEFPRASSPAVNAPGTSPFGSEPGALKVAVPKVGTPDMGRGAHRSPSALRPIAPAASGSAQVTPATPGLPRPAPASPRQATPAPLTPAAAAPAHLSAVQPTAVQPTAAQPTAQPTVRGQPTAVQARPEVLAAPAPSPVAPKGLQAALPTDQLAALARLTGYRCEHLGSGVVRLLAELGPYSYSVLIATSPEVLNTPAWNESCDYMALLTPEDQRPQGIPRFTTAALEALLEHARLAPLTPIDLRGYWNTGSFDQASVESVAEFVSSHLAQRGSFSHVLTTLAQQPAHSVVQLTRLAERLGSGVNTAELQSILETLCRPPFLALTPLPGGQYYLRSEVGELLAELGEYAQTMRRRLKA